MRSSDAPHDDNAARAGLIGGVEKREILIADYNPAWPEQFQEQAQVIRHALGDSALRVEHIGSTSVPGLPAKPIIDVLVVVVDSGREAGYLLAMEAAGYELRVREPWFHEHRMFRTPARDVHVHFVSKGCPEVERWLTFRDRLRRNEGDRRRYAETKRVLALSDWPDMNAYADAKSELIEEIIAAARREGQVST